MANKLFKKPKNVREKTYSSISKHNAERGSEYILFDPPNVTDFACTKGEIDGKVAYLRERLSCMWGNEDIEEYVLTDCARRDVFDAYADESVALKNKHRYFKAKVGEITIEYSHKKGMFARHHYNVWFELDGVYYYLYIKTSDGKKFKALMEDFIQRGVT